MDKRNNPFPEPGGGGRSRLPTVDSFGGERVSVSSIEERMSSGKAGYDYSTTRSRKHRRKQEAGSGKYLWISVCVVVFVYAAVLAVHTLQSRSRPAPAPRTAVVEAPAATESEPVTVETEPEALDPGAPVAGLIEDIRRAQRLADEGRRLLRNRQYVAAEVKLEEAARLAPNVFDIQSDLASILHEQGKSAAARDVLVRALSINPGSVPTRMLLARILFGLRQYQDALDMALWAIEAEPYSEEAHQIAADVYTVLDRHDEAIHHWQKITALNSNNFAARNNLGAALLRVGQLPQAITTFESVVRNDPGNSQALYYLAVCFVRKDEPELAVGVLSSAANRLGIQFVKAWTKSPDFDAIRDLPVFKRQFADGDAVAAEPAAMPEPVESTN